MRLYVGLVTRAWLRRMRTSRPADVVVWTAAARGFRALRPGEPFLCKLHAPDHAIVGGGWFVRALTLPASQLWMAFGPDAGADDPAALLAAITRAIQAEFRYEARDAEGTQPAPETLRRGAGACRDFALLMMEACRSLGIASRFVSGYLYDAEMVDAATAVVGGGATHAWCDVYVPGAGWVEFDPTNGLIAGRNLIRVAVARTPEQAVPIAGSWTGAPASFLGLNVEVEVAVEAAAPPAQ